MFQTRTVVMFCCLLLTATQATAQVPVDELKSRVDQLETKVKLLERLVTSLLEERESESSKGTTQKDTSSSTSAARVAQADENAVDAFRVGVTWVGELKGTGGKAGKWAISVSERNGDKFGGGMVVVGPNGEKLELPISGTVPVTGNGLVIMETPLVGRQKAFARGRMQNGEIALTFKATNKLGEDVIGACTLRPKN
ncbi:MAG: hypothetical protein SFV81_19500 [Pirellulaceae bacterium]|nr:hypothetical protein [Pirellulaceae bacterium]